MNHHLPSSPGTPQDPSIPRGNVLKNLSGLLHLLRQREAKVLLLQQLDEQVKRNSSDNCMEQLIFMGHTLWQ